MSPGENLEEVRATYDAVASTYAAQIPGLSAEAGLDVAMIDSFVARVLAERPGTVLDVGSGPGRVTAYLAAQGLDCFGIDLSPEMVQTARTEHPELRFEVGSIEALDLTDGSLAGVLAWYSTIHFPLAALESVYAELHRVIRPGGYLLVGFYAGDGTRRISHAYGQDVGIDLHPFPVAAVADLLRRAGFAIVATVEREPEGRESSPQASVLARA